MGPHELTVEQALRAIPDGECVHTFRNPGGMLVGADWGRAEIEAAIRATDAIVLTGPMARGMGHGLAINYDDRPLYIQTDEDRLASIEAEREPVVVEGSE